MFKEGRERVEDEPWVGRSSNSRTRDRQETCGIFAEHGQAFNCMIVGILEIKKIVVHKIFGEDLEMTKICVKLFPKVLMGEQKQTSEVISSDILV